MPAVPTHKHYGIRHLFSPTLKKNSTF